MARRWLDAWLKQPFHDLGGQVPIALLETADGRSVVRQLIAAQESGAHWQRVGPSGELVHMNCVVNCAKRPLRTAGFDSP